MIGPERFNTTSLFLGRRVPNVVVYRTMKCTVTLQRTHKVEEKVNTKSISSSEVHLETVTTPSPFSLPSRCLPGITTTSHYRL